MKNRARLLAKRCVCALGSLWLAILLISATAMVVIVGTLVESLTTSHRLASHYTYESPIFSALLCGFFINILTSALLRFPFRPKHIPFLITHLGLLMVITGQLVKKHCGVQGILSVAEGSSSNKILIESSYAMAIEERESGKKTLHPIDPQLIPYPLKSSAGYPKVTLLDYAPNVNTCLDSWVKEQCIAINGLAPFKIESPGTPFSVQAHLPGSLPIKWHLKGIGTNATAETACQYYIDSTFVHVRESASEQTLQTLPLSQLLAEGVATPFGRLTVNLQRSEKGLPSQLAVQFGENFLCLPLAGSQALLNIHSQEGLGKLPIAIDLMAEPALLFLQNALKQLFLFGWTAHGEVLWEDSPGALMAYDNGFAGYSQETTLTFHMSRQQQEQQQLAALYEQLAMARPLSPPLELLKAAALKCEADFPAIASAFLSTWHTGSGWLCTAAVAKEVQLVLDAIDWQAVPLSIYRGCAWTVQVFEQIASKKNVAALLQDRGYPLSLFSQPLSEMSLEDIFQAITEHMFSISAPLPKTPYSSAKLLSAYFRAYHIHLSHLPYQESLEYIELGAAVTARHSAALRNQKLENEIPGIWVQIEDEDMCEVVALAYDASASEIKWPVLGGKYALRFQPIEQDLPHHVRLREARQINYTDSHQPYSYESDLLIRENHAAEELEKTISMNTVHETTDGYRFYLAHISKSDALKRVDIIVNRDPTRYALTYFGSGLTALGTILLFWLHRKKSPPALK